MHDGIRAGSRYVRGLDDPAVRNCSALPESFSAEARPQLRSRLPAGLDGIMNTTPNPDEPYPAA
jgi:hypothetical protein